MRIVLSVLSHARRKWTLRPVRFLRTFRQFDSEKTQYERREAKLAYAQKSRCNHRVENARRYETERSSHQSQIEIRPLQHDFFFGERSGERRQINSGECIDQKIFAAKTELEQTELFKIGMQAVGFRVDRNAIERFQFGKQLGELRSGSDHVAKPQISKPKPQGKSKLQSSIITTPSS